MKRTVKKICTDISNKQVKEALGRYCQEARKLGAVDAKVVIR